MTQVNIFTSTRLFWGTVALTNHNAENHNASVLLLFCLNSDNCFPVIPDIYEKKKKNLNSVYPVKYFSSSSLNFWVWEGFSDFKKIKTVSTCF